VYFPHLLSNTGNSSDIFHVCGSDYLDGVIGVSNADTSTPCTNWQIHQDGVINGAGNGQPDPGEQRISVRGAGGVCTEENTITLPADSHVNLVISCAIPIAAAANDVIGVTITAQAEQGTGTEVVGSVFDYTDGIDLGTNGRDTLDDTNNDVVTVTFDASLTESKSATYDDNSADPLASGNTPNNNDDDGVDYVLTIGNNGGSAATNVFVYDFLDPRTHDVDVNDDLTIDAADLAAIEGLTAPGSAYFEVFAVAGGADLTPIVDADADFIAIPAAMPQFGAGAVPRLNPFAAPTLAIVVYYADIPHTNTRNISFGINTEDGLVPQTVNVLDRIDNTFSTVSDETEDDDSNETQLSVEPNFGGAIGDTGDALGGNGVNDGGDDDATDNADDEDLADTQFVDVAPNGSTVLFRNEITNDGTVADCFTIRVVGGADGQAIADNYLTADARLDAAAVATGFPAGTAFSVYAATNSNQVVGNCGGEVGVNLNPGQTLTVVIRASLPPTYFGTNNLVATTIINSTGAIAASLHTAVTGTTPGITTGPLSGGGTGPNDTEYWDVKAELVGAVTPPAGDLTNNAADGNSAINTHAVPLESIRTNGNDALTPTTTLVGAIGGTVDFTLVVQNDSGQNDTFQLTSGSALQAISAAALASPGSPSADTTLAALLPGWGVQFFNASNALISSTVSLGPNQTQVITARVTVPALASQALYNHDLAALTAESSDVNGSGSQAGATITIDANDVMDGNADSAGDYAIFFRIQSLASGATDIKLDSVQVTETELVVLTEDNNGTVQPGGTIEYAHQLINQGNTDEIVQLYDSQSGTVDGWNHIILVPVAVGGDPNITTLVPLAGLTTGNLVVIVDPVLGPIQVAVTAPQTPALGGGDDTYVGIPLTPGQYIDLTDRVNAPTNAPDGYTDTVTIGAVYDFGVDDDLVAERTDITNVQLGQVRLIKTNAVDHDCDGDVSSEFADGSGTRVDGSDIEPGFLPTGVSNTFRVDNLAQVQPGECVIWRIVAKNEGTAVITDLVITDANPDFTSYVDATIRTCNGGPTDGTCDTAPEFFGFTAEDGTTANLATPPHFADANVISGVLAGINEVDFRFFVGQANVAGENVDRTLEGGELAPNQEVTVTFSTRVE
jgi:uncharacterized repeat protein (TIGR01451 family)